MNVSSRQAVVVIISVAIIFGIISSPAFAASQTFTGVIGDAMCGAKHVMPGNDLSCTQQCIAKGSKYALVVGEKVYVLDTADKDLLSKFEVKAGEKITITGTEKNKTITVTSVKAAH